MNAMQTILMPYVEARAGQIMEKKEEERKVPVCATQTEIMAGIAGDVTECMRELCRNGIYKGSRGLNQPMLLKI